MPLLHRRDGEVPHRAAFAEHLRELSERFERSDDPGKYRETLEALVKLGSWAIEVIADQDAGEPEGGG